MTMVKRSKKNVLLVLLLTCILSATLVILRVHITSATEEWRNISVERIFDVTYPTWDSSYNRTYGVHVKNNGTTSENFTLTIYNTTDSQLMVIGEKNVSLSSGTEEIIKFTLNYSSVSDYPDDPSSAWNGNTSGYFIHEINATASTVEDEAITEDNSKIANVTVKWPGDYDGDGYINQADLNNVTAAASGDPEFPDMNYISNVSADFYCNGEIDIQDIVTCVLNQGKGPLDYADINVTGIFPVTYPTWDSSGNLTFAVTVKNKGWGNTTGFNLTIYNGTTPLATKTNLILGPKAHEIIKFTLNCTALDEYPDNPENLTMPYPTHTIKANATELPNEWNTEDNSCGNTTVTVRWPGDANGDGHVNGTDLSMLQSVFNKEFPDPEYDPQADFNCDGTIDIVDEVLIAQHWHNGPVDHCDITITNIMLRLPNQPLEPLSMAYPDWTINIYITVKNNGNNTEPTINIKAYYRINNTNWIYIGNTTVHNLARGEQDTPTIPWEVPNISKFPYDNYTVKANATACTYEDDKTNNNRTDGTVTVRWPGDATHDGYVNFTDLEMLRNATVHGYSVDTDGDGVKDGMEADFDGDGVTDLDDVVILTDNWGEVPKD